MRLTERLSSENRQVTFDFPNNSRDRVFKNKIKRYVRSMYHGIVARNRRPLERANTREGEAAAQ